MKFFKRDEPAPAPVAEAAEPPDSPVRTGLLSRLRAGLGKTRSAMSEGLASLFLGRKTLDDDLLEELETRLLLADVGVKTTREVLDALTRRVKHRELGDADALARLAAISQRVQANPGRVKAADLIERAARG